MTHVDDPFVRCSFRCVLRYALSSQRVLPRRSRTGACCSEDASEFRVDPALPYAHSMLAVCARWAGTITQTPIGSGRLRFGSQTMQRRVRTAERLRESRADPGAGGARGGGVCDRASGSSNSVQIDARRGSRVTRPRARDSRTLGRSQDPARERRQHDQWQLRRESLLRRSRRSALCKRRTTG